VNAVTANVLELPLSTEVDPERRFEAVYRAHFHRVYRWVARLAPQADSEDLSQEVFLVVHRRLPEFEGKARISTWLFQITYHVVGTYLRRRRSEQRIKAVSSLITAPDAGEAAQAALEREEEVSAVREALGTLDLKHRTVLVMYELEQWSGADIAEALAIPVETVYSRLHYARRKLASRLAARLGRKR
jgi:RNA polymerase sigma-70 factor, ECF subfamily